MPTRHILVAHHDADLYGADKSLLRTLRVLQSGPFKPILVIPHSGPLLELLRADNIETHIGPVGKLSRQLLKPTAFPAVVSDLASSVRFISSVIRGRPIALAYSNSVAVLGGALWAKLHSIPRLWHVREIVVAPKVAAHGFPAMLQLLGGWCVCNSGATRDWIVGMRPRLANRSSVIWNGLEEIALPTQESVSAFRSRVGVEPGQLLVTLVGRLNRWKGQGLLIAAAKRLQEQGLTHVRYAIVGDVADGQSRFRDSMMREIAAAGLGDIVRWHPFTADVDAVWAGSDIAVVPSTEPEPFGRVAIEAMAHGLPVIAANHGGLAEIVEHGISGLLVKPNDVDALANAIRRLADANAIRLAMGEAGRARQQQHFSQEEHDRKLMALVHSLISGAPDLRGVKVSNT